MKNATLKFWTFSPIISLFTSLVIFVVLLSIVVFLRLKYNFPLDGSVTVLFVGILIFSLLPIALAIVDTIIERGASIEYKDFKVDFSKIQQLGTVGFTIPVNIGERGQAVSDSGTFNIIQSLKNATSSGIVVIDLEDGHAWWETRLLVLLSGADRLRKPEKIVFVATEGKKEQCFQGWATPSDLLHCLLQSNIQYNNLFAIARAAANQLQMIEPLEVLPPANTAPQPLIPSWVSGQASQNHFWMAFDNDGSPNELLAEQILQDELGKKIERSPGGSNHISIQRLNELFKSILINESIDQTLTLEEQSGAFLKSNLSTVIITNNCKYESVISRMAILNEILKSIMDKNR